MRHTLQHPQGGLSHEVAAIQQRSFLGTKEVKLVYLEKMETTLDVIDRKKELAAFFDEVYWSDRDNARFDAALFLPCFILCEKIMNGTLPRKTYLNTSLDNKLLEEEAFNIVVKHTDVIFDFFLVLGDLVGGDIIEDDGGRIIEGSCPGNSSVVDERSSQHEAMATCLKRCPTFFAMPSTIRIGSHFFLAASIGTRLVPHPASRSRDMHVHTIPVNLDKIERGLEGYVARFLVKSQSVYYTRLFRSTHSR